jgi:hypothetical protein
MPLDPWIIEEIIRREKEDKRRREQEQPRIDAPPPSRPDEGPDGVERKPEEEKDRGVTIIDISGGDDDKKDSRSGNATERERSGYGEVMDLI